jgi:hypothetical protein
LLCAGSAIKEAEVLQKDLKASRGETKNAIAKLQEAKRELAR